MTVYIAGFLSNILLMWLVSSYAAYRLTAHIEVSKPYRVVIILAGPIYLLALLIWYKWK